MPPKLTKARKEELAEQALAMNCKGKSYTAISEDLRVNWKTAKGLVRYALDKRDIDRNAERERSLAHHREVIRWCWEELDSDELKTNAQNRPAYISRIQYSISEMDRLNDVRPPVRTQNEHTHYEGGLDLEAEFRKLDERLGLSG